MHIGRQDIAGEVLMWATAVYSGRSEPDRTSTELDGPFSGAPVTHYHCATQLVPQVA